MQPPSAPERHLPGRFQALLFLAKSRVFQLRRAFADARARPPRHAPGETLAGAPVIAEVRAPLWRDLSPAEFPLTAGKVENLRRAAAAFHRREIPAAQVFSFWRQLGRTTHRRGFIAGRELREGCMIPAVGGGLCQLSGLLYQAALAAGLEIVERHAHSRVLPGSAAEQDRDATVFWNYVDLRFRSDTPWRIEVELTAAELVVRFRAPQRQESAIPAATPAKPAPPPSSAPARAATTGDCLTCGMISCFRHPAATAAHAPAMGHSAYLLDARWPELDAWCAGHSRPGDRWLLPLDGHRWKKPNYAWTPPAGIAVHATTLATLRRAWRQRRLPAQGALRQRQLLADDAALARRYAARLSPECRHLVIAQNLLPHLWRSGALGGRSFDVLLQRWPLAELQRRLDAAAERHPDSSTLGDFRADPALVQAEQEALAAAARLITPHQALARHFGARAWRIDWEMPAPRPRPAAAPTSAAAPAPQHLFFPASRLGRKGAFELAAALRSFPQLELRYLGRAREGGADPFAGLAATPGTLADLATAAVLVLPAWIEHQPRLALLALASGIPVIATEACGLPEHPLRHALATPDAAALRTLLGALLAPTPASAPACALC